MKAVRGHAPGEYRLTRDRAVWLFMLCSVLGYFIESADVFIGKGAPGRHGLLYGPLAPVYGAGALLFALLYPLFQNRNELFSFLLLCAAGAVFEYLCSFAQEKLFGTVSWEYTGFGLDWDGRTNLVLALCWGALGLFMIKIGYPLFCRGLDKVPRVLRTVVSLVLLVLLTCNLFLTGAAIWRQAERRSHVPASTPFSAFLDRTYPDDRLKEIFPNMKVVGDRGVKVDTLPLATNPGSVPKAPDW